MLKKKTLRQAVIELHNKMFNVQIKHDEANVSPLVMMSIVCLYLDCAGSPLEGASIAQDCMEKIEDENLKLQICKKLLEGKKVHIPGMCGEFWIY